MASKLKKRVATKDSYARVRENNAEMGRSMKAGVLLTNSVKALTNVAADSELTSRLAKEMKSVLKADTASKRGMRVVTSAGIVLLRGFEFNMDSKLGSIFFAPFTTVIDRPAGTLTINIPEFTPKVMLKAPFGTTHFRFTSAASCIDFAANTRSSIYTNSAHLVYGDQTEPAVTLSNAVEANSTRTLFLVLGVQFFQETNGEFYVLNSGTHNPLAIVEVNAAV